MLEAQCQMLSINYLICTTTVYDSVMDGKFLSPSPPPPKSYVEALTPHLTVVWRYVLW